MADKNKLISLGFNLIKSDESKSMFVFENNRGLLFSLRETEYILSDTLTL